MYEDKEREKEKKRNTNACQKEKVMTAANRHFGRTRPMCIRTNSRSSMVTVVAWEWWKDFQWRNDAEAAQTPSTQFLTNTTNIKFYQSSGRPKMPKHDREKIMDYGIQLWWCQLYKSLGVVKYFVYFVLDLGNEHVSLVLLTQIHISIGVSGTTKTTHRSHFIWS